MAQSYADYPRLLPNHSHPPPPIPPHIGLHPSPARPDVPVALPSMSQNWCARYGPSISSRESPPSRQRGYLPSPTPSTSSRSLSPRNSAFASEESVRSPPSSGATPPYNPSLAATVTWPAPPPPPPLPPPPRGSTHAANMAGPPSGTGSAPYGSSPLAPGLSYQQQQQPQQQHQPYHPQHYHYHHRQPHNNQARTHNYQPQQQRQPQQHRHQQQQLLQFQHHRTARNDQPTSYTSAPARALMPLSRPALQPAEKTTLAPVAITTATTPAPLDHVLCDAASSPCRAPSPSHGYHNEPCETTRWLGLLDGLRRVPPHVLHHICTYVDYEKLILLRQLNRFMRDNVDAQLAPYEDKVAFVIHAELRFAQHQPQSEDKGRKRQPRGGTRGRGRGREKMEGGSDEDEEERTGHRPGNFGCYHDCFRVLGPENFEGSGWTNLREKQTDAAAAASAASASVSAAVMPPPVDPFLDGSGRAHHSLSPSLPSSPSSSSSPSSLLLLPPDGRLTPPYPPPPPPPALPVLPHNTQLRRYCIRCGVKYGYHRPGRYIERKRGKKIWVCRCLRTHEYGIVNCSDCGSCCPFSRNDRYP